MCSTRVSMWEVSLCLGGVCNLLWPQKMVFSDAFEIISSLPFFYGGVCLRWSFVVATTTIVSSFFFSFFSLSFHRFPHMIFFLLSFMNEKGQGFFFFIIFDGSPFSYNGFKNKKSKYYFAKSSNNLTIKCFFNGQKPYIKINLE